MTIIIVSIVLAALFGVGLGRYELYTDKVENGELDSDQDLA